MPLGRAAPRQREHAPEAWLDGLRDGLASAKQRIVAYPRSGTVVRQDPRVVLRVSSFRGRLPYLVYYVHPNGEPVEVVYLVRLFHYRQRRALPRLSAWPS